LTSREVKTTRANLGYFLLGVFVTLSVVAIFSLGSKLFFTWQQGATPLVTGERDLDKLIQTDVDLFWTFQPNLKNVEVNEVLADDKNTPSTYTYSTNELGFRSPPLFPAGSRFRILAIGDSTTFGQHVADHETWPAQLQQLLDPEAKQIEVINAGVIGASSFQGLAFLQTRGLALQPDLVIATFGFGDWSAAHLSDRDRARAYQRHGVLDMLEVAFLGEDPQEVSANLVPRATPGEYLDNMLAIANLCEKNAIPVFLINWPKPYDLKDPENKYGSLIMEACKRSNAHSFELSPFFRNATEPVFIDRVHATPAGCRIVAESLAAYFKERHWLP